jgi:hypothetical protein
MQIKKKQHYVPQCYLRLFKIIDSSRDKLWCYDKSLIPNPRLVSISSIAYQKHYYSQINPDGSKNLELENVLSSIEEQAIAVIKSIKPDRGTNQVILDVAQQGLIAFFTALQFYRCPSFRDGIKEIHREIALKSLDVLIRQGVIEKPTFEVDCKVEEWVSLRPMVDAITQLSEHLLTSKYWQFNFSVGSSTFITCDTPVIMDNADAKDFGPYRPGPLFPTTEFTFALRKDLCLVFTHRNPDPAKNHMAFNADDEWIEKCNLGAIRAANRQIYSSSKIDLDAHIRENLSYRQGIEVSS